MDYEKEYKEICQQLMAAYNTTSFIEVREAIEKIHPELKENEDERIRKEIIQFLQLPHPQFVGKRNHEEWIVWLEKQKENSDTFTNEDERIICKMITHFKSKTKDTWCNMPVKDIICCLEKLKELKPTESLKAERDGWYVCIKDYNRGGKRQCSVGDMVQAKGGMHMMGEEDISEWFRRAYYEEVRDAFEHNTDMNIPKKSAEWSKEKQQTISFAIDWLTRMHERAITPEAKCDIERVIMGLKSLRPSWKPSEEQMICLKEAINKFDFCDAENAGLQALYEQLEKL